MAEDVTPAGTAWRTAPYGAGGTGSGDAGPISPALVHYVVTRCRPRPAGYEATILDLAARGLLALRADAGAVLVALRDARPPALAGYERRVLGDVTGRLRGVGSAPLEALAQACVVDVRGTWEPFTEALSAAAKEQELVGPRIRITGGAVPLALATTATVALTAGAAARLLWPGTGGAVAVAAGAALVFGFFLIWLATADAPTEHGRRLAALALQELDVSPGSAGSPSAAGRGFGQVAARAEAGELRRCAIAVACGAPRALPGQPGRAGRAGRAGRTGRADRAGRAGRAGRADRAGRAGRATAIPQGPPDVRGRPRQAWSSFSGTWRPVPIPPGSASGSTGGVLSLVAATAALAIGWIFAGPAGYGPKAFVFAAPVAVFFAVIGVRTMSRIAALPRQITFDGQVIARWHELSDSETSSDDVPHVAVDDGTRAWVFSGKAVFEKVALADYVRVTMSPRSDSLIDLTVTERAIARP